MTSVERAQILRYGVAWNILCEKNAERRIEALKYGKRDMSMIRKKLGQMLEEMLHNAPDDQEKQLRQHLRYGSLTIGVAKTDKALHDRTYGSFITIAAQQALVEASVEKCRLCMLDKHAAKKCDLRAALNEQYIQGVTGTENDCPYYQL